MKNSLLPALSSLVLAACATTPPTGPEDYPRKCSSADTAEFIGQPATQEVGAQIQQRTRAEIFNWIAPGMIVTADFRVNRVRVSYDEDYMITRITCG